MTDLIELSNLVEQYGVNKAKLDDIKKTCDLENAEIKTRMQDENITEAFGENYKVKYSVQHRESMDEEKLLTILASEEFKEVKEVFRIVKTKEYVDFDALENALYNSQFTDEQLRELNRAREVKEIPMIKITKIKKEN